MTAPFATPTDLAALLGVTFDAQETARAQALLEAASDHLRVVIGQEVYPQRTTTFEAWPDFGRVDLPQWPVIDVASVTRDGEPVDYRRRPGYLEVRGDDPVEVTFTYGYADPPAELARLACVLASQAIQSLETSGALTAGGLSSLAIDDFRAAFADGGASTGIALTPHAEKSIRRAFGRGDIVVVEAHA